MSLNSKELIKLASACRKAGIKHFKTPEYEFTLTDELPAPSPYKQKKLAKEAPKTSDIFESDSLTEEQLLMWSTGSSDGANEEGSAS